MGKFDKSVDAFIRSLNNEETKQVMGAIKKYHTSLYESVAINSLAQSNMIFGGVGKCHNFDPLGLYIEGWFFPRNAYTSIEIYRGNEFLGYANLDKKRIDVYNRYSFFDLKNCGFDAWMTSDKHFSSGEKIAIVLKKNERIVKKQIKTIEYSSMSEAFETVKSNLHTTNNIFIPTLSNRMTLIREIANVLPEYNIVTMIEGMEFSINKFEEVCVTKYKMKKEDLNNIFYFLAPGNMLRNNVPRCELSGNVSFNSKNTINDPQIAEASENFAYKYNISLKYAEAFCNASYVFFEQVMKIVKPKGILIWNKFSPAHLMLALVAEHCHIPVVYMESGVLPGTLIFEQGGQMGESYPAVHSDEFKNLVVSCDDISKAEILQKNLKQNKLNRWTSSDPSVYDKSEKDIVLEQLAENRPTVFYAGQNDLESGLFPYNEITRKYHSPYFESSEEAAVYLAKICKENNWNFLYKRHPMMRGIHCVELPDNAIVSDNIDIHDAIDIADLTVTILSQTSYVSLIRETAALMLGYHQLHKKDCIYEPDSKEDIERCIKKALKEGYTDSQRKAFIKHIAQLCKYYVYRDFTNKAIKYGKSIEDLSIYLDAVFRKTDVSNMDVSNYLEDNNDSNTLITLPMKFTYEISFSDRLHRKKMLKQLQNMLSLDEIISINKLQKDLMLISQITPSILESINWRKKLSDHVRELLVHDNFTRIEDLKFVDKEVDKRLDISHTIFETIVNGAKEYELFKHIVSMFLSSDSGHFNQKQLEWIVNTVKSEEDIANSMKLYAGDNDRDAYMRVMVMELLARAGLVDSNFIHNLMDALNKVDDIEMQFIFAVMEMDRLTFLYPEMIYDDYYLERRELLCKLSDRLQTSASRSKNKQEKSGNNIIILTPGLHGKNYASTRLQVGVANELAKRGYRVTIFATDTNYSYRDDIFPVMPMTARYNTSKSIYQKDHWILLETNVNVRYFTENSDYITRYHNVIEAVYKINPCAIIDVTNEGAIYNFELVKDYNVITLPLSGYWSSAIYTNYMARNIELTKKANEKYHSIDLSRSKEANVYIPYEIDKIKKDRKKYGFSASDVLLISVGNRLGYELLPEYQKDMKSLLENNENIKWILVGIYDNECFEVLKDEISCGQVVLWGYENNLSQLYRMCDIYIDVPRVGGGGGSALACQAGLPVVNVKIPSDILPYLGINNSSESWEKAIDLLQKLIDSKQERRRLWARQNGNLRKKEWSLEHYVDVIESVI